MPTPILYCKTTAKSEEGEEEGGGAFIIDAYALPIAEYAHFHTRSRIEVAMQTADLSDAFQSSFLNGITVKARNATR